jgi:peptidoglycan/LPS O-acetylase OafA/YrhL
MTPPLSTAVGHNSSDSARARLVQLDWLRGVAILLVLLHHTPMPASDLGSIEPFVAPFIRIGWSGVDMFFILSGFLVGGLLFSEIAKTGSINVRRFLIRRAFKLWPSYAVFIVYYVAKLIHRGDSVSGALRAVWPNFVHLQNYIHVENPFALAPEHTWSLAVEEHFYLTLPLLLLFLIHCMRRERLSLIPWLAAALLIVCLGLRATNVARPFYRYTHLFPTHLRIDTLFLGVCLSYLYYFQAPLWRRFAVRKTLPLALGLAFIAPMLWLPGKSPFVFTAGITMLAFGYAFLLVAAVPPPGQPAPASAFWRSPLVRGVAWIGLYSYSIYLWHRDLGIEPVQHWLEPVWRGFGPAWQGIAFLILGIAASVAAGSVMGKLVEFPVLRLRERFFRPKNSPAPSMAISDAKCFPAA